MELENEPNTTGAPGRTSCANAIPDKASAYNCAEVAAIVTGDIAPAIQKGETTHA